MEKEILESFFKNLNTDIKIENLNYANGFEIFSQEKVDDVEEAKRKNIKKSSAKHRYFHYEKFETEKKGIAIYILFNPSNATSDKDDTTVKSCREIAQNEGYGKMIIVNLFSERSTKSNLFNKSYMNNSVNNKTNTKFIEYLFQNIDLNSCTFIKAWGFAKNDAYTDIIEHIENLIPKNATKKIIGIKEIAINMNHHPGCIKWIGGTKFAELKDEFIPTELDA